MADPKQAVDFALRLEDSTLSGIITNTPGDLGGTTRFGLTRKNHPELDARGFYDPNMPAAEALPIAEESYAIGYANPLRISEISDQAIATALLSFAINCGSHEGVKALQVATVSLGRIMETDGVIGPATLDAVNITDAPTLLSAYCVQMRDYYSAIVARNPSQQKFLRGWNNRVDAIVALAA